MIMIKGVLLTIARAATLPSESIEEDRPHRYSVSMLEYKR